MKVTPILFSGQMVRAIIDGRKTMTRRVVNRVRGFGRINEFQRSDTHGYDFCFRDREGRLHDVKHQRVLDLAPCQPGDRLWVRETWAHSNMPDGPLTQDCDIFYRADYFDATHGSDGEKSPEKKDRKWAPSIFMPRQVSRITLDVTGVRMERLQDITEDDALAEGGDAMLCRNLNEQEKCSGVSSGGPIIEPENPYRNGFAFLWDALDPKSGFEWGADPWVWVIEFRRVNS